MPVLRKTMRAVRLDEVGPAENLRVVEKPVPEPGPDEVLIKVELAGLIFGDVEARRGTYFTETRTPWFPGREAAGYIAAVGSRVRAFSAGDAWWRCAPRSAAGCDTPPPPPAGPAGSLPGSATGIIRLPDNVSFAQARISDQFLWRLFVPARASGARHHHRRRCRRGGMTR
jgi:NADPH2:quinone reductase